MSEQSEKDIFSNNLNRLMQLNGKSQIDLIEDLGINKSTISTWCRGTKMPRMGTIQTLADYFGVRKSDLIEEKLAKPTNNDRLNEFIELCSRLNDDDLDIIETLIDSLIKKHDKED